MATSIKLRFLFANHDGLYKILEFPLDSTGEKVKTEILDNWPKELDSVDDTRRFRLFLMGKEIDSKSNKTLKSMNIPVYAHPTPVNVSVLPKSVETPVSRNPSSKGVNGDMIAKGCCIIS